MNTHDEETLLDAHGNPNESKQETVNTPEAEVKNDAPPTKGKNIFKKVATGVGAAAVAGGAVMAFMAFKEPDEPILDPNPHSPTPQHPMTDPLTDPMTFDGSQVPMATCVTDDMSINEAFAAARAELGPGGVFQSHGGTFSTYYANEWQALSPDYQHAFSNYPYVFEIDDPAPIHPVPDVVLHHDHFGDLPIYTDEHGNQFILVEDFAGNEIRINPEHLGYVVFDDDGSIVGITHDGALYDPYDDIYYTGDEIIADDVVVLEPSDEMYEDQIFIADDPDAIVIDSEDEIIIADDVDLSVHEVLDSDVSDMDLMDNDLLADFDNDADISNFV